METFAQVDQGWRFGERDQLGHGQPPLLQAVLHDPAWAAKFTEDDRRGLSPLFRAHVNPYGRFTLDMDTHLNLAT
jgi:hypothetical protein